MRYQKSTWKMILSRPRRKKLDNVNVSFEDVNYYNLVINKTDQSASTSNAHFFRDGCKIHPLKNTSAQSHMARFKWIKINHVSWYFKAFIVNYTKSVIVPVPQDKDKARGVTKLSLPAVSQINSDLGFVPYFLTWDLDGHYQQKVSTERNEDDMHNRKLYIGSKKPVVFKWTVPQQLRRYFNTDDVKGKKWDTDNLKDCFDAFEGGKYRYPGWFNGTRGQFFDTIPVDTVGGVLPFQIILVSTFYVNCTFKGLTSN